MGACVGKSRGDKILPRKERRPAADLDSSTSVVPSETSNVEATKPGLNQGHHWAEGSPGKERRVASRPWEPRPKGSTVNASAAAGGTEPDVCEPCASTETSSRLSLSRLSTSADSFEFRCSFPMMVMKMETFMELDQMLPYEEMIKEKKVFEWTPDMGRVFFLSHQWTSFVHPDPKSEQLEVAQTFLNKVAKGMIKSLFATQEEWEAFHYKEANWFLHFDPVTEEEMAEDVKNGYVWLDYASVPQAADAEEERLRAIDSIPYYVDHALVFCAIVPKLAHKDLPGTFCTYKSWQDRGWCRLETQVHELRLFVQQDGELMPGVPKLDLPRRPLIIHSGNYATTYDMVTATAATVLCSPRWPFVSTDHCCLPVRRWTTFTWAGSARHLSSRENSRAAALATGARAPTANRSRSHATRRASGRSCGLCGSARSSTSRRRLPLYGGCSTGGGRRMPT